MRKLLVRKRVEEAVGRECGANAQYQNTAKQARFSMLNPVNIGASSGIF